MPAAMTNFHDWLDHWNQRVVDTTRRYPERSNADIARLATDATRKPTDDDVVAARIYLGGAFPEAASHDGRCRLFYLLAQFHRLDAHLEVSLGGKRADVVLGRRADEYDPMMVIEVKSGEASPAAVRQVAFYRSQLPEWTQAIVTAPAFSASAHREAELRDVRLLSGAQTSDAIRSLAHRVLAGVAA